MLRLMQVSALVGPLCCANGSIDLRNSRDLGTELPAPTLISFSYDRRPSANDLSNAKSRRFSIRPVTRDASSHAVFNADSRVTCAKSPELTFDSKPIKKYLVSHGEPIKDVKVRQSQLLIVTQPHIRPKGDLASYYMVVVSLDGCVTDGVKKVCNVRASAVQKTAPVEGHQIKVSLATDGDDEVTTSLIDLAANTVPEATFWCSLKSTINKTFKKLEY